MAGCVYTLYLGWPVPIEQDWAIANVARPAQ